MSYVWHACGNCGGRFPCEASDERDETIADIRRDLVIARGRVEELTANLARVLAETDAHLTTAYADRDRFDSEATAMRAQVEARDAAVREYLAAEANADEAHTGSLCIVGEMGSDEVDAAGDRIVAAIKTLAAARAALVALVGGAM